MDFLLALCSAKQIGKLCIFSVSGDCQQWKADGMGVSLSLTLHLPKVKPQLQFRYWSWFNINHFLTCRTGAATSESVFSEGTAYYVIVLSLEES